MSGDRKEAVPTASSDRGQKAKSGEQETASGERRGPALQMWEVWLEEGRRRLREMSLQERSEALRRLAAEFKREHRHCAKCGVATTDIHHSRGRAGALLIDTRFSCRSAGCATNGLLPILARQGVRGCCVMPENGIKDTR